MLHASDIDARDRMEIAGVADRLATRVSSDTKMDGICSNRQARLEGRERGERPLVVSSI